MESVICLSSCSVVLRYLVSSAGAIHGEFPLRPKNSDKDAAHLDRIFLTYTVKITQYALKSRVLNAMIPRAMP